MITILIVLKLPVFEKIPYVTSIDGIKTFDVIQTIPSTDDIEYRHGPTDFFVYLVVCCFFFLLVSPTRAAAIGV